MYSLSFSLICHRARTKFPRVSLSLSLSTPFSDPRRATSNETSGFRNFSKISEPLPLHSRVQECVSALLASPGYHHRVPPLRFIPFHPLRISRSLPFQTPRGGRSGRKGRSNPIEARKGTDKRWINSSNHAIPVINRAHENATLVDILAPFVLSWNFPLRFTISRPLSYRVHQNCCHF